MLDSADPGGTASADPGGTASATILDFLPYCCSMAWGQTKSNKIQPLQKKKKIHPKPATQAPVIHSRFSSINFKSKHVNIENKFSDKASVSNFSGILKNEIAPRLHLNE